MNKKKYIFYDFIIGNLNEKKFKEKDLFSEIFFINTLKIINQN